MKTIIVGIGLMDCAIGRALVNLAAQQSGEEVIIVHEQGPPRPAEETLRNHAAEFKKTLSAMRLNVNAPATSDQPFYASLPKYRKRKP